VVVYRDGPDVRPLGLLDRPPATTHDLDPFVTRALLAGLTTGEVAVVDAATGRILARRDVARGMRVRPRTFPRRLGGRPPGPAAASEDRAAD
jgi:hypothetical protein